jgi:hypothetical protein
MESERRKYKRRNRGFIIDYQHIREENGRLGKRAASVNVSKEGLCIYSRFEESEDDVLLLTIPYVTPNPGIFAAKIKHAVKSEHSGYLYGLYVLPLFQERFAVVDTIAIVSEPIELELESREAEFIRNAAGEESLVGPVIEGICNFWSAINPRIDTQISSIDELTAFLSKELDKRRSGG